MSTNLNININMNKIAFYSALLILALTLTMPTTQLSFTLKPYVPTCIKIPNKNNSNDNDRTYIIEYIVLGQGGNNVTMQIFDYGGNDPQLLVTQEGVKQYQTQVTFHTSRTTSTTATTTASVCFTTASKSDKNIMLSIEDKQFSFAHDFIEKTEIVTVATSLSQATRTMSLLANMVAAKIETDEINRDILKHSEHSIQIAGIVKIALLVASAILQLCIAKAFLKKGAGGYRPVDTLHM